MKIIELWNSILKQRKLKIDIQVRENLINYAILIGK